MAEKQQQQQIYERLAQLGGAMSNPHRLKMISLLAQGEKTIDELAGLTGQSLALTSSHIKVLRNSHLIETDKRGRSVYCRLADERAADLWLRFRDLGETVVPEIREIMRTRFDNDEGLSPLGPTDLADRLADGRVSLLDLRSPSEFQQGHLPRAQNVPFATLSEAAAELPRRRALLVYCRGPFCAAAFEGNRWLREQRYKSQRLRFSVPEWKAAGLPVETV
ncbi:ArsR/SmtB family transcription factor [Roseimaritima sediminicola]|uniref:ArsR/SmtB family transcription factor n=1 Tax=Roseimaritima sediminicola TaxID=2662066 RepID=UPI00129843A5|nr:metalloregulator ArsR/SmtB family transcription factor [Roseimaritima sediminicola]